MSKWIVRIGCDWLVRAPYTTQPLVTRDRKEATVLTSREEAVRMRDQLSAGTRHIARIVQIVPANSAVIIGELREDNERLRRQLENVRNDRNKLIDQEQGLKAERDRLVVEREQLQGRIKTVQEEYAKLADTNRKWGNTLSEISHQLIRGGWVHE